jgi:amino acid efflux transporter
MMTSLNKSLGVFRGAAILLNIVIGAGLLTLPGLAVRQSGQFAIYAWLICAVASCSAADIQKQGV